MADKSKCENCIFFQKQRKAMVGRPPKETAVGECRKHPPAVTWVSIAHGADVDRFTGWPSVDGNDWCGEFCGSISNDPN